MITILDSNLNFMMTKFNDQITLIKKKKQIKSNFYCICVHRQKITTNY